MQACEQQASALLVVLGQAHAAPAVVLHVVVEVGVVVEADLIAEVRVRGGVEVWWGSCRLGGTRSTAPAGSTHSAVLASSTVVTVVTGGAFDTLVAVVAARAVVAVN